MLVGTLLVTFWGHWAGSFCAGVWKMLCLLACLLMSLLLLSLPGMRVRAVQMPTARLVMVWSLAKAGVP